MNLAEVDDRTISEKCASCGAEMNGTFCSNCGEKKLIPENDFSLIKFLEHTLDDLTHFDSKFFRSFWLLLTRPGFLTNENLTGRRVNYMKPVQIFIITIVIFFLFFPHSVTYFTGIQELQNGYDHNVPLQNLFRFDPSIIINQKIKTEATNYNEVNKLFIAHGVTSAKAFLILIVPFFSICVYLLNFTANRYFVPHIIFALHSFSVFLIIDMLFLKTWFLLGAASVSDYQFIPLLLLYFIHLTISLKKVYKSNRLFTITKSVALCCTLIVLIIIYRQAIGIYTLKML